MTQDIKSGHDNARIFTSACQYFVRTSCSLESDGPFIFSALTRLQEGISACAVQHYLDIHAVARKLEEEKQELEQVAKDCVRPAVLFFSSLTLRLEQLWMHLSMQHTLTGPK